MLQAAGERLQNGPKMRKTAIFARAEPKSERGQKVQPGLPVGDCVCEFLNGQARLERPAQYRVRSTENRERNAGPEFGRKETTPLGGTQGVPPKPEIRAGWTATSTL